MKLISDIINELVDTNKSLNSALLKTKVLATRIKNDELLIWVNDEINGYSRDKKTPVYRKYIGRLTGNCVAGNYRLNNHPLTTTGLSKELSEGILDMTLYDSVHALESMEKEFKKGHLEKTIPPELTGEIAKKYRERGNPFFGILSAKCTLGVNEITQVLGVVRSLLLDFMLKIEEEFGSYTEIKDLQNKNKKITQIMSQTIINKGDGNVINTGESAKIKADINIKKGDFDALRKFLSDSGISQNDLDDLESVIDKNVPKNKDEKFSGPVNSWIKKLMGKALDGSWQVAIGAAGNILGTAIQSYYGF